MAADGWGNEMNMAKILEELDRESVIDEQMVCNILVKLIDVLVGEDNIVRVQSPVCICGNVHGQYEDLKLLFEVADCPAMRFVFMGDYVDHGKYSLNTFLLLAIYKIENPKSFFLLRGNHESRSVSQQYGFNQEIINNSGHADSWSKCMKAFDLLPIVAVTDEDIVSIHGGLSPDWMLLSNVLEKDRRREIPAHGIFADLAWSDPEDGMAKLEWRPNSRGTGYIFGRGPINCFCQCNRLRLVTRSHQLVQDGYRWYCRDGTEDPPGTLINVWSAPNYVYRQGNSASILKLRFDGALEFDLSVFTAAEIRIPEQEIKASEYFAEDSSNRQHLLHRPSA
jgi:diadenosine tetraphosphatase ApaH/serine/threonine PP2A family protein phosphatase